VRQFLVGTPIDSSKQSLKVFGNVAWGQEPPNELIDFNIVFPFRSLPSRRFDEPESAVMILTLQTEKIQKKANCDKITVLHASIYVALSLEVVTRTRSFSQRPKKCKAVAEVLAQESCFCVWRERFHTPDENKLSHGFRLRNFRDWPN
jgi:hypothetical protein